MVKTNNDWNAMSDGAIILEIGRYIRHHRLEKNITQAKAAEIAGVNRWTLNKIEKGEPISLLTLISVLRALDLLHILNVFKISTQLSPIQLAKLEQKKRQRARSSKGTVVNEEDWEW